MVNKNKQSKNQVPLIILGSLLIISALLNVYLLDQRSKSQKEKTLNETLSRINRSIAAYCRDNNEKTLVDSTKTLSPISNALVENYEGRKSFYFSYPNSDGVWSDSRFLIDSAGCDSFIRQFSL